MISTHPIALHPQAPSSTRILRHWNIGLVLYGLAGLGLILALGWMAFEMARALGDPGAMVVAAVSPTPDSSAGSPADLSDGDDEEAFPSLLSAALLASLISYPTLPPWIGLAFYHPPLLQPPQPG
jgi:hypothetical protein